MTYVGVAPEAVSILGAGWLGVDAMLQDAPGVTSMNRMNGVVCVPVGVAL